MDQSRPSAVPHRRRLAGLLTVAALCLGGAVATPALAAAPEGDITDGLVHRFVLDETSGTVLANTGSAGAAANATLVNPERVALTGSGVRFNPDDYAYSLEGGYAQLPADLTAGMSSVTVDYDIWIDPANVGEHQIWGIGAKASCDDAAGQQGQLLSSNTQRLRVAVGTVNVQQNRVRLAEGVWKHVTYTQAQNPDGTTWTGTLYVDGVQHAQAADITTSPAVNAAGTNCNYLARSQNPGHYAFRGTLSDFRVYDRALSADEAATRAHAGNEDGVAADADAIDLGLTSAVVTDLELPHLGDVAGSTISWESSDDTVIDVVTPPAVNSARKVPIRGVITRPPLGASDAQAVLTATVRKGPDSVTQREIPITVKAEFDSAQSVERDTLELELYATDDVRGHIDLPAEGDWGSVITWESSDAAISPTGEVTRPAYGQPEHRATLIATVSGDGVSQQKSFDVVVKPLPRDEEYERYFLGYFKGEGQADGEQIMFATSNGNTALDWTGLTGGMPSLVSQLGDQGLRDPHIVRSPDGDTFYMIATDLNWYDQGGYAINDTQYIEVFESNDLVNWTPQRHVKVAPDDAGNAFAPESLWVDEIGAYAVFWAQSLWSDPVNRTGQGNAQMWYNTTRDFQTFSEPQVWQNPAPQSRIDTTAIKVDDTYYRVTKNEAGNAGSDIFSEKNADFLDSDISAWELVAPALGRTTWQPDAGYEGPVIFEANPGDTACPGQFYLWGDRYTNGGGYQAACEADIEAQTWNPKTITMTNAGVPRPRHGTVIPLTLREWNNIRGIANEDVDTTTELVVADAVEGEAAVATATVTASDGFQTGGQVRFSVGDWSAEAYLEDGSASVTLPADLAAGASEVTAQFLGHEILRASQAQVDFEVTPAVPAAVTVSERCAAGKLLLTVRVENAGEQEMSARVESDFGAKTFASVAAGAGATHAFTTRQAAVPAGAVTVTVTAETSGGPRESVYETEYGALSCGR
ncbi:Ig-like domain repeat protein [Microbacterium sp. zg.Y1090]|uniref:immunoglobulin-like domain-containing protein n=1 Tax=Microbacterium wangruii TaxID=3049073 RepID=UPI00214B2462|nr:MULTISPECIES: immunoglobulin-like domain-containing protein [unclassified Microbacterium]MCR2817780.1 Ig-like domain repeat protein [Microbacterium sp. zg.Y1090]WIM28747.1 Ig-like domain repeat protein [Microbacterium sp. zg-Y1090]